jgi:hypothetical protein
MINKESRLKLSEDLSQYLRFTIIDPKSEDGKEVSLNLNEIFSMIRELGSNREETIEEILKIKLGVEKLYLSCREECDELKAKLDTCAVKLRDIYARNDASNPIYGRQKITVAAIQTAVESDDEYKTILQEYRIAESYKSYIFIAVDALRDFLSIVKAVINNPVKSATGLESEDADTIHKIVNMISEDGE